MKKDPAGNNLQSPTITYHINSHTGLKPKTYFIHTYWTKANYAIGYNLLNNQISRGSEINTPISELIVINFAGEAKRITHQDPEETRPQDRPKYLRGSK